MKTCDVCGKNISFFTQVELSDGKVCEDCYHFAFGKSTVASNCKELSWVFMNIDKKKNKYSNFYPTYKLNCGLLIDMEHSMFKYDGYFHDFTNIRSYNAFLNGQKYVFYKRDKTYSNLDHRVVNKANGTCIIFQLNSIREYPDYFSINFSSKESFDQCLSFLRIICDKADETDLASRKLLDRELKLFELENEERKLKEEIRKINKLRSEIFDKNR